MSPSRRSDRLRALALGALAAGLAACGGGETASPAGAEPLHSPVWPPPGEPFDTLSEYRFFQGPLAEQRPSAGVVPYTVASPLWADHAGKGRLIVLPAGGKITLGEGEQEEWQFPVGTIVVKTFFFSMDQRDPEGRARMLETRLLILDEEGWKPHAYVWNDEQTEAERVIAGKRVKVDFTDAAGAPAHTEYLVPNNNQCKSCHERDDATMLLGPITPQMNLVVDTPYGPRNQLDWMAEQGMFDSAIPDPAGLPAFPDPRGDAPLDARARAYLHANCSHCHRPGGGGGPSGLVLLAWEQEPLKNGVCKGSVAAGSGTGGHQYDIVPGAPEQSIMTFRMSSTDPEIKMPELPNRIPDEEGIALVSAWIAAMDPPGCNVSTP